MSTEQNEIAATDLVLLYHYIRICLYKHHGRALHPPHLFKDMQSDIWLYAVDKKGITEFNAGSRRYVYLMSQFYPKWIQQYRYHSFREIPLGPKSFQVPATDMTGDIQHDLDLYTPPPEISGKPGQGVVVYFNGGEVKKYTSIKNAYTDLNCGETMFYSWLKHGRPTKRSNKFSHIIKVEYMLNNPFAGSRTKIVKSITLAQWSKREDQEDFEEEDANEYYVLKVYRPSKEGWLIKLPAAKTNPYIK